MESAVERKWERREGREEKEEVIWVRSAGGMEVGVGDCVVWVSCERLETEGDNEGTYEGAEEEVVVVGGGGVVEESGMVGIAGVSEKEILCGRIFFSGLWVFWTWSILVARVEFVGCEKHIRAVN